MKKFTTDELRYIRGMATVKFHEELKKRNCGKADIFKGICVKAQNEIVKRSNK